VWQEGKYSIAGMKMNDRLKFLGIAALLLITVVVVPLMNTFGGEGSIFGVSNFTMNLWGKYLAYSLLAVSLNLLWGYTGLLCLGQCLFFSLGAYAFGMHLMLLIGEQGAYKSVLPDFMVFLGYTELPSHWKPFYSFWFATWAVLWVPGLVALIFGFLAFRSRIRGVYFSIMTQAITYAACLLFYRNDFTFGGNNGFTDFKLILGQPINAAATQRGLFMATGAMLTLSLIFCWWLLGTKYGKVQQAIRDSENRVLFSGYSTTSYKLFIFVVAAVMAGIAGALYVPQVGIVNPEELQPYKSLEVVVWVAVGGRATLWGPIIGAIFVNSLKSWATYHYPEYWIIILGSLFALCVLFLPGGITSLAPHAKNWIEWGLARYKNRSGANPAGPVE
jgi:urea transport system permease protein